LLEVPQLLVLFRHLHLSLLVRRRPDAVPGTHVLSVEGGYFPIRANVGVELKGVRSGVERQASRCVGIETEGWWAERCAG
jgi:hypothetical protein